MLDMSDERCRVTASSALSSLADADVEVLQALGAASFVAMAREATKPLARASACAFISKLARNSDTHETIREGGGVETLASMTLRGHAEATWGLASMASCEENWDVVHESMTPETLDALKRLITSDNEYATEGAAWACCYMAADWRLQLALVKSGVLPPLVALVKAGGGGSRRVKKAAERALKALSSTRLE
uniref:Uncharacterized protein n=1 Tax=Micromonas pusilla TaxID=38833 RepID=A0A7R9XYE6_MICPS|mmetsp:Transcript_14656/g.52753  ORF Transcript_14656/g.52753 Transcript_14656/m.52753 type:complete len:191 (+) Transcript_14656:104-676(+)